MDKLSNDLTRRPGQFAYHFGKMTLVIYATDMAIDWVSVKYIKSFLSEKMDAQMVDAWIKSLKLAGVLTAVTYA